MVVDRLTPPGPVLVEFIKNMRGPSMTALTAASGFRRTAQVAMSWT
jgi:hypothetical protein